MRIFAKPVHQIVSHIIKDPGLVFAMPVINKVEKVILWHVMPVLRVQLLLLAYLIVFYVALGHSLQNQEQVNVHFVLQVILLHLKDLLVVILVRQENMPQKKV